jgi:uncharacterized protein YhhL (DUF1145 family)
MLMLLKLGCLVVYALGLAGAAGWLHGTPAAIFEFLSGVLVAVHVLELPIFWKALHAYPGSLASSVLQSLLFGVLHSLPLKRAAGG